MAGGNDHDEQSAAQPSGLGKYLAGTSQGPSQVHGDAIGRDWPLDIPTCELLLAAERIIGCLPSSSSRGFTRLHPQLQEALLVFRHQRARYGAITFTTMSPADLGIALDVSQLGFSTEEAT